MEGARRNSMLGRAFGPGGVAAGAPKLDGSGFNITLTGGLERAPARVSMRGLFKEVDVIGRPKLTLADTGDASP